MRVFAAMLFALKLIFDAAKSSAFTVGCLRTLFYIKMQKVAKSRKLECTLDVLCHLYQTQMLQMLQCSNMGSRGLVDRVLDL